MQKFSAILLSLVLSLVVLTPLSAQVVALRPAPDQARSGGAMRPATLSVQNPTAGIVGAVALRCRDGGPAVVADAVIPPGQRTELIVPLPAMAAQQTYDVRLLASPRDATSGAAPLASMPCQISWPAELVNPERFLCPPGEQVAMPPAAWPPALKRNLLLAMVIGTLAMAAVLLLRPGIVRLVALGVVVAGTTLAAGAVLGRADLVVQSRSRVDLQGRSHEVLALASRRTVKVACKGRPGGECTPLYLDQWQVRDDDMVLYTSGAGPSGRFELPARLKLQLHPGQVRLFEWSGAYSFEPEGQPDVLPLPLPLPLPPSSPSSGPASPSGPASDG